jgi:hypothetical protein
MEIFVRDKFNLDYVHIIERERGKEGEGGREIPVLATLS